MMLEELERRNYSEGTIRCYLRAVADFARYFHRSPDHLRPEHVRQYQAYLFRERKLQATSVTQRLAALRFFFLKTLKKRWGMEETPLPQEGASPAHHTQPGGSCPAHRFRSYPLLPHPGDDPSMPPAHVVPRWRDSKSAISTASAWRAYPRRQGP